MLIIHPRVFPIPIGIQNKQWCYNNITIMNTIILTQKEKLHDIYFNFNISTCSIERTKCYTTIDEWIGETIRNGWNPEEQSIISGIPIDEIKLGVWPAIEEFLNSNKEWILHERYTNNNGLTILKKLI
jgi:hypothetical protein